MPTDHDTEAPPASPAGAGDDPVADDAGGEPVSEPVADDADAAPAAADEPVAAEASRAPGDEPVADDAGDESRTAAGDADAPGVPRRPGTTHPRLARERALKVLFQADVRGEDARLVLDRIETTRGALDLLDELEPDQDQVDAEPDLQLELTRRSRLPMDDYTRQLVGGVASRRSAIDRLLGEVSNNWAVTRMPAVDRNLLRLAIHELVVEDTPHPVVIDEAVALARGFAGDKAVSFVNGVLETVRQAVARGDVDLGDAAERPDPAAASAPAGDDGESSDEVQADAAASSAATATGGGAGGGAAAAGAGGGAGPDDAADAPAPEPEPDAHGAAAWNDALDLLGRAPAPSPATQPITEPPPAAADTATTAADVDAAASADPAADPGADAAADAAAEVDATELADAPTDLDATEDADAPTGASPDDAEASAAGVEVADLDGDGVADGVDDDDDDDDDDDRPRDADPELFDDEDDLDPETEVAILLGELGPDGEPLDDPVDELVGEDDEDDDGADTAAASCDAGSDDEDDDGEDAAAADEDDDRLEGLDEMAGAEQDALFGDDFDDED